MPRFKAALTRRPRAQTHPQRRNPHGVHQQRQAGPKPYRGPHPQRGPQPQRRQPQPGPGCQRPQRSHHTGSTPAAAIGRSSEGDESVKAGAGALEAASIAAPAMAAIAPPDRMRKSNMSSKIRQPL
jgi:hypothetical protein